VTENFDIKGIKGLSEKDAAKRFKESGPNELPSGKKRSFLAIAYEVAREPMFLMLVAC